MLDAVSEALDVSSKLHSRWTRRTEKSLDLESKSKREIVCYRS